MLHLPLLAHRPPRTRQSVEVTLTTSYLPPAWIVPPEFYQNLPLRKNVFLRPDTIFRFGATLMLVEIVLTINEAQQYFAKIFPVLGQKTGIRPERRESLEFPPHAEPEETRLTGLKSFTGAKKVAQPNRLSRGNPVGGIRPAAPRATRHKVRSASVRVRPVSPPIAQLKPSSKRKLVASDRPPSRYF